jgi:hypothetical protein
MSIVTDRFRVIAGDDLLQRSHGQRLLNHEHALGQIRWNVLKSDQQLLHCCPVKEYKQRDGRIRIHPHPSDPVSHPDLGTELRYF